MNSRRFIEALRNRPRHWLARYRAKQPARFTGPAPVVSFSFDDFPVSAYEQGTRLLDRHRFKATYYVSCGLMDKETESGRIAGPGVVARLVADGNEVGCHTFDHADAWEVGSNQFEDSIIRNAGQMRRLFPDVSLKTFAYPKGSATPGVKKVVGRHFRCGRGIYWGVNRGPLDRNLLASCGIFGRQTNGPGYDQIIRTIDEVHESNGWLIFYAHDIAENPSPYGCTPGLFDAVVEQVVRRKLRVATVAEVAENHLQPGRR